MRPKIIAHIGEIKVTPEGGAGRVAWHWIRNLENRGYEVLQFGTHEVGPLFHSSLFPYAASRCLKRSGKTPDLLLVHEPASGVFINRKIPVVLFSHGLERRNWNQRLDNPILSEGKIRLRTRLLFPLWRLRQCERGLANARRLLLINSDDRLFVMNHYKRSSEDIFVFKNGVESVNEDWKGPSTDGRFTVLFNGTWIKRKGIDTLVTAAELLQARSVPIYWLLIGTGCDESQVRSSWPRNLQSFLEIVPSFMSSEERKFLARASVFVLPSLFEGQPLSLLQAMASGMCCITTNTCGQKDLVVDKSNGILFEPGDAKALAAEIEAVLRDPVYRGNLGHAARISMRGRDWARVAEETMSWVTSVID